MRTAVLSFTEQGKRTGAMIEKGLKKQGQEVSFVSFPECKMALKEYTMQAFQREDGLIFVGAAGIAVRAVAPFLKGKTVDPAVVVVDEKGQYAISLLSGHLGGANELALLTASILGGTPVITTATDVNQTFAVDLFAKKNGLLIRDFNEAKNISAAVLRGEKVGFFSDFPVEGDLPPSLVMGEWKEYNICVSCREKCFDEHRILLLTPRAAVLGMGCRKGAALEDVKATACEALKQGEISQEAVLKLATIDIKREEEAFRELAVEWNLEFETFTSESLAQVKGEFQESDFVRRVTGVGNVCERAAMAGAGSENATLIVKKCSSAKATAALAVRAWRVTF